MVPRIVYKENDIKKANTAKIININPLTNILSAKEVLLSSMSLLKSLYSLYTNLPKKIEAANSMTKIIFNKISIIIFVLHQSQPS